MPYLVDTDLIVEGIIKRPQYSFDTFNFWKQAELSKQEDTIYVTKIGFDKIRSIVESFVNSEEKIEAIMSSIKECFEIFPVDREILLEARKVELITPDFESAIELVCAKKIAQKVVNKNRLYVPIISDRHHDFQPLKLETTLSTKVINSQHFVKSAEIGELFSQSLKRPSGYDVDFRCNNLVNYYIKFAQEYGGIDWGYYADRYDRIEDEWLIVQKVINYCSDRAERDKDYYDKFKYLCDLLNRFCDLYHHQEERINWLTQLKKLSLKYKIQEDYFFASMRMAWALVMTGSFEEAKEELESAAKEIDMIKDLDPQALCYFYHCYVTYHGNVSKKEWEEAQLAVNHQFESYRKLEWKLNQKNDPEKSKILLREYINVKRGIAKILYRKAWFDACSKITPSIGTDEKDRIVAEALSLLHQSLDYFNSCLEDSISLDWQRGVSYCYHQIVNVKLYLAYFTKEHSKRNKFIEEANHYLTIGLQIAVRNKNYRRIAAYYESTSFLNYLKGNKLEEEQASHVSTHLFELTGERNSEIPKPDSLVY
jgi:hypothetical protein